MTHYYTSIGSDHLFGVNGSIFTPGIRVASMVTAEDLFGRLVGAFMAREMAFWTVCLMLCLFQVVRRTEKL
jgi:hypothetical protein